MITVHSSAATFTIHFTLQESGDPRPSARGYDGAWIVLTMRAKRALFWWISVNSHLCAFRLGVSVRANSSQLKCFHLFFVP